MICSLIPNHVLMTILHITHLVVDVVMAPDWTMRSWFACEP